MQVKTWSETGIQWIMISSNSLNSISEQDFHQDFLIFMTPNHLQESYTSISKWNESSPRFLLHICSWLILLLVMVYTYISPQNCNTYAKLLGWHEVLKNSWDKRRRRQTFSTANTHSYVNPARIPKTVYNSKQYW